MRIVHRVAFAATPAEKKQLDDLGIKLSKVTAMPGGGDPLIAFDIGEDDPVWPPLPFVPMDSETTGRRK